MIGIATDQQFEEELKRTKCVVRTDEEFPPNLSGQIITKNSPGRKEGDLNVPQPLRKLIASTAVEEGRQSALDLANSFGISSQSVDAYSHGATSEATYNQPNRDLATHVNSTREKISIQARKKLLLAINQLTRDRLETVKPRDAAAIARDMSAVVRNMEEKINPVVDGPKFIFYAPQIKDERHFEVIESKE